MLLRINCCDFRNALLHLADFNSVLEVKPALYVCSVSWILYTTKSSNVSNHTRVNLRTPVRNTSMINSPGNHEKERKNECMPIKKDYLDNFILIELTWQIVSFPQVLILRWTVFSGFQGDSPRPVYAHEFICIPTAHVLYVAECLTVYVCIKSLLSSCACSFSNTASEI